MFLVTMFLKIYIKWMTHWVQLEEIFLKIKIH
jgi:hypothetical protein